MVWDRRGFRRHGWGPELYDRECFYIGAEADRPKASRSERYTVTPKASTGLEMGAPLPNRLYGLMECGELP